MFSIYKIPTFHLEERMINFERERECFVGLYQYYEFMVGTFPGIFSVDVWWILIFSGMFLVHSWWGGEGWPAAPRPAQEPPLTGAGVIAC